MRDVLAVLATVGVLAAAVGAVAGLGSRIRRRGIGGGLMGPIDEIYNPAAHRSRLEIQVQEQRAMPTTSADDEDQRHGPPDASPTRNRILEV